MIKLPLFILTYILFLIIRTILIIIGWITVPIASLMGKYHTRESKIYENRLVRAFTQDFMWIWGNEEEGIGYYGSFKSLVHKIIYSECFRNPVNNLRYVPILSFKINKEKVRIP